MARTLLVAGTASHVGKSTVVAGLCRLLSRAGVSVAPFKAQNMSNNARVAVRPAEASVGRTDQWGEIGVSQYVQARAAGVTPTTDLNPVLLKPRGDGESQLVVHGEAVDHVAAGAYYDDHWKRAREAAVESFDRLAAAHDVVVAEGAGSVAEINLRDRDLANVETARFADASVLLLGDIERGGVFASLYGTLELMPDDVRERVRGTVVTKFRGDESLLESGIAELERLTGVPVLGVLPDDDPGLPAEDSVSLPTDGEGGVSLPTDGDETGHGDDSPTTPTVTVAVPRLPRISNFTDLDPLADEPGVRVSYRPPGASLDGADAVVLPGTKNAVDDLLALHDAGFGVELDAFDGPVVGICGGYQLLGERLTNAHVEGTGDASVVEGFGRLPVETRFARAKRVERVAVEVDGSGLLAGATGTASGYEIHTGRTTATAPVARPLGERSAATGETLGTYLHGLFENESVREAFVEAVFESAGLDRPSPSPDADDPESPYDAAASLVERIDLSPAFEGGVPGSTE